MSRTKKQMIASIRKQLRTLQWEDPDWLEEPLLHFREEGAPEWIHVLCQDYDMEKDWRTQQAIWEDADSIIDDLQEGPARYGGVVTVGALTREVNRVLARLEPNDMIVPIDSHVSVIGYLKMPAANELRCADSVLKEHIAEKTKAAKNKITTEISLTIGKLLERGMEKEVLVALQSIKRKRRKKHEL